MSPLEALRHHVSGAIDRGEATAIPEVREEGWTDVPVMILHDMSLIAAIDLMNYSDYAPEVRTRRNPSGRLTWEYRGYVDGVTWVSPRELLDDFQRAVNDLESIYYSEDD